MSGDEAIKVALVGNPNTGKTSIFNELTGLNQKVGNYPGITVEKKVGIAHLANGNKATIIDLPGTYSINPNSLDENIVLDTLLNSSRDDFPNVVVVVADIENIKRNLLLFSQVKDLGIPTILVVNMVDVMEKRGIKLDIDLLKKELDAEVILVSARKRQGIDKIKNAILNYRNLNTNSLANIANRIDKEYFKQIKASFPDLPLYRVWLYITQAENFDDLERSQIDTIKNYRKDEEKLKRYKLKETIYRYQQ